MLLRWLANVTLDKACTFGVLLPFGDNASKSLNIYAFLNNIELFDHVVVIS